MAEGQATVTYREIPGFPGYLVGDDGSVWCCRGIGHHRGRLTDNWRLMAQHAVESGHLYVHLNPGRRFRYVHRLVLEAFVGPRPDGMLCRHFPDRNPANNRLDNLRWGTHAENHTDQTVHGTDSVGVRNAAAKLSEEQVRAIRAEYAAGGVSQEAVGRKYGISQSQTASIVRGHSWKHVA